MNAIMISIHPEWCEKIASGKKTIEVRKTRPKIDVPFTCYIYETASCIFSRDILGREYYHGFQGKGMVIGEFLCRKIGAFPMQSASVKELSAMSIVSEKELLKYAGKNTLLYGWHISDLVIYDKPKDISSFRHPCPNDGPWCTMCRYVKNYRGKLLCGSILTRPPQSWCYVDDAPI